MSNAEKLQKTMVDAAKKFDQQPAYLKKESSRPQSVSIYRTVRPTADAVMCLDNLKGENMKNCNEHDVPGCKNCDEEYPYTGVQNIFNRNAKTLMACDDSEWMDKIARD